MTGAYRVYVTHWNDPPDTYGRNEVWPRKWHSWVSICRSLARDGLEYEVFLERIVRKDLAFGKQHELVCLTIRAWGTPKRRRQARAATRARDIGPPMLTAEQIGRRLQEAESCLASAKRR